MKRVLSSGSIKLPYVQGSEQDLIKSFELHIDPSLFTPEQFIEKIYLIYREYFCDIKFKFELKAPFTILNNIQNTHLGHLTILKDQGDLEAYLPPQFYKFDASGFNPMGSKSCNELSTKINNFHNWAFNFYKKLLESGLCEEQARLVLPQGLFTTFLWDVDALTLIRFIEENYHTSPEMYGYCSTFVLYLEEHLPLLTKWLKKNQWNTFNL